MINVFFLLNSFKNYKKSKLMSQFNANTQYQKDETYPLRLMKHEFKKLKLDFIVHCGVRNLLYNGDFFGITTNVEWNNRTKLLSVINQSKDHYFDELKSVLHRNMRYVIRNKELVHTPFLSNLADVEMCNGLGVYSKNNIGVSGYFFTARHDDKEAINFFVNHLHLFKSIVDKIDKQLIQGSYWRNVSIRSDDKSLFKQEERRLIFSNKNMRYLPCKILLDDKEIELTRRQIQILDLLKDSSATKDLAETLNIETRTVEWHLDEIRKKTGFHRKNELIDFASTLQVN